MVAVEVLTRASLAVVLAALAGTAVAGPEGPSFDCRKASSADERLICSDRTLGCVDGLVAAAFKAYAGSEGSAARTAARKLLAERRQCGADVACIASVQLDALGLYGAQPPPWAAAYRDAAVLQKADEALARFGPRAAQPIPSRLGQCTVTTIDHLGTRRGDEPLQTAEADMGSSVDFANGGYQVSYEREPALVSSEVGDPVAICLISLPRDCPPGDDRGRVYLTLNARTQATWSLADASHMCGGA